MKSVMAAAAFVALACAATPSAAESAEAAAPAVAAVAAEPLHQALTTYAAFQADIDEVNNGSIKNAKDLERALDKAAALNRDALTKGFIAYGALTAARDATFVAEVRKVAAAWGKERTVNGLIMNRAYAATLPGADKAMGYIIRAAGADAVRIQSAGDTVKNKAREAQQLAWGKAAAGKAAPRMARLKALGAEAKTASIAPELADKLKVSAGMGAPDAASFGGEAFWRSLKGPETATLTALPAAPQSFTWGATSGGSGIRSSMLTLAAMYALDATKDRPADTEKLMNDKITNGCLQGAQLQYYQCVASAKFNYENLACVGEAGLQTVGSCVKDATK